MVIAVYILVSWNQSALPAFLDLLFFFKYVQTI